GGLLFLAEIVHYAHISLRIRASGSLFSASPENGAGGLHPDSGPPHLHKPDRHHCQHRVPPARPGSRLLIPLPIPELPPAAEWPECLPHPAPTAFRRGQRGRRCNGLTANVP